ncbi:TPA: hypothetical protein ACH3X3_001887 [Trebouxia sp. C0006]
MGSQQAQPMSHLMDAVILTRRMHSSHSFRRMLIKSNCKMIQHRRMGMVHHAHARQLQFQMAADQHKTEYTLNRQNAQAASSGQQLHQQRQRQTDTPYEHTVATGIGHPISQGSIACEQPDRQTHLLQRHELFADQRLLNAPRRRRHADAKDNWSVLDFLRSYIAAVLDILDPEGDIFGQRVIAGHRAQFKTLDRGLEGKESISLMIDDLKVMWPHHQSNLRDVEAYCFFPHNLTNVNSAKLSGHDESGSRGTLVHLEKSMRECHRRVFTAVEQVDGPSGPDMKELQQRSWGVPHVLPMMRKEVLGGTVVLFSGFTDQEKTLLTHELQAFGGSPAIADGTLMCAATHVVAKLYTQKVQDVYHVMEQAIRRKPCVAAPSCAPPIQPAVKVQISTDCAAAAQLHLSLFVSSPFNAKALKRIGEDHEEILRIHRLLHPHHALLL